MRTSFYAFRKFPDRLNYFRFSYYLWRGLMKCLTSNECSDWLRQRGIIELPYVNNRQLMCLQFESPRDPRKLTAFVRWLFGTFGEFPGALLQFTDWNTHNADETALFSSLRRIHGEQRAL